MSAPQHCSEFIANDDAFYGVVSDSSALLKSSLILLLTCSVLLSVGAIDKGPCLEHFCFLLGHGDENLHVANGEKTSSA